MYKYKNNATIYILYINAGQEVRYVDNEQLTIRD